MQFLWLEDSFRSASIFHLVHPSSAFMWMGETIGEICRVHVGNIFESVYLVNLAVGQKKKYLSANE